MSNLTSHIVNLKLLIALYVTTIILLFFYSFTQVDLNLTLSRLSIYQTAEKYFQQIGYFQRYLSAEIYIAILLLLFAFYFFFLALAKKNRISKKQLWMLVISTAVILTFSYNAFSYDLFNYIFDAKIVTHYHQSPYLYRALDFAGEPMLSFMRWTHRVYPYGPTWLGLTVPLSFIGLNVFLPTFFIFKALMSASFLGTAYFIGKILKKVSPKTEILGLAFFALNPLVIIESLVSSHNDITMMFFAMMALYLFLSQKYVRAFILLFISIGVKFATGFILPVLAGALVWKRFKRNIPRGNIVILICALMSTAIVVASVRTNFQPWYLLYVLPFAALLPNKYYIAFPSVILSFSSLLIYVPFLQNGNWDPPIPERLFWITAVGAAFALVSVLVFRFKNLLE